jgi:hypothetical protein
MAKMQVEEELMEAVSEPSGQGEEKHEKAEGVAAGEHPPKTSLSSEPKSSVEAQLADYQSRVAALENARDAEAKALREAELRAAEAEDRVEEAKARVTEAEAKLAAAEDRLEAMTAARVRAAAREREEQDAKVKAEKKAATAEDLAAKAKADLAKLQVPQPQTPPEPQPPPPQPWRRALVIGLLTIGSILLIGFVLSIFLSIFGSIIPKSVKEPAKITYTNDLYLFTITYTPGQNWTQRERENGVLISRKNGANMVAGIPSPEGIYVGFVPPAAFPCYPCESYEPYDSYAPYEPPEQQLQQRVDTEISPLFDLLESGIIQQRQIGGGRVVGVFLQGVLKTTRQQLKWYEALVSYPDQHYFGGFYGERLYCIRVVAPSIVWEEDKIWPIYDKVIQGINFTSVYQDKR